MKKHFVFFCVLTAALLISGCKGGDYKKAVRLMEAEEYWDAANYFSRLGDYKDSGTLESYCRGMDEMKGAKKPEDFKSAYHSFKNAGDYGGATPRAIDCLARFIHRENLSEYKDELDLFSEKQRRLIAETCLELLNDSESTGIIYNAFKLIALYEDQLEDDEKADFENIVLREVYDVLNVKEISSMTLSGFAGALGEMSPVTEFNDLTEKVYQAALKALFDKDPVKRKKKDQWENRLWLMDWLTFEEGLFSV
jgi:hypothetical protein